MQSTPEKNKVTLLDGRVVDSDDPDWASECLARFIYDIPRVEKRREWLEAFDNVKGPEYGQTLRALMLQMHEKKNTRTKAEEGVDASVRPVA